MAHSVLYILVQFSDLKFKCWHIVRYKYNLQCFFTTFSIPHPCPGDNFVVFPLEKIHDIGILWQRRCCANCLGHYVITIHRRHWWTDTLPYQYRAQCSIVWYEHFFKLCNTPICLWITTHFANDSSNSRYTEICYDKCENVTDLVSWQWITCWPKTTNCSSVALSATPDRTYECKLHYVAAITCIMLTNV